MIDINDCYCQIIKPEEEKTYDGPRLNLLEAMSYQSYVAMYMACLDALKPDLSHEEKLKLVQKYSLEWFKDSEGLRDAIRRYASGHYSEYSCPFIEEEKSCHSNE